MFGRRWRSCDCICVNNSWFGRLFSTKENGFGPQVDDCPKAGLNLKIQTELLLQDCSVPPAEDAYTVQVLDLNEIELGPSVDEKLFWYNCLGGMLTILN